MKPMNVDPKQEVAEASQLESPVVDLAVKTEKSVTKDPNRTKLILSPVTPGMF